MNILERIFATKREEVTAAKSTTTASELRDKANAYPLLPFREALADSPHAVSLIAEVKKASPSKGLIRIDFEPLSIARSYASVGVDCISVLTDEPYFQGSPDYLGLVKAEVGLPCLRKDFLYDPYQVLEARAWGADAVLLIATHLSRMQINDLRGEAESLGMDVLLEVYNEAEAEIAVDMKFDLVGVNNRDLRDFKTRIANSERLMPVLAKELPGAVLVGESAIETLADVQQLQGAGARSVLIGTAFCAAPDIEGKVREVMGW